MLNENLIKKILNAVKNDGDLARCFDNEKSQGILKNILDLLTQEEMNFLEESYKNDLIKLLKEVTASVKTVEDLAREVSYLYRGQYYEALIQLIEKKFFVCFNLKSELKTEFKNEIKVERFRTQKCEEFFISALCERISSEMVFKFKTLMDSSELTPEIESESSSTDELSLLQRQYILGSLARSAHLFTTGLNFDFRTAVVKGYYHFFLSELEENLKSIPVSDVKLKKIAHLINTNYYKLLIKSSPKAKEKIEIMLKGLDLPQISINDSVEDIDAIKFLEDSIEGITLGQEHYYLDPFLNETEKEILNLILIIKFCPPGVLIEKEGSCYYYIINAIQKQASIIPTIVESAFSSSEVRDSIKEKLKETLTKETFTYAFSLMECVGIDKKFVLSNDGTPVLVNKSDPREDIITTESLCNVLVRNNTPKTIDHFFKRLAIANRQSQISDIVKILIPAILSQNLKIEDYNIYYNELFLSFKDMKINRDLLPLLKELGSALCRLYANSDTDLEELANFLRNNSSPQLFDIYIKSLQLKFSNNPNALKDKIEKVVLNKKLLMISKNTALFFESLNINYNPKAVILDESHIINALSPVIPTLFIIPKQKAIEANNTALTIKYTHPNKTTENIETWELPQPILNSMGLGAIDLAYEQTDDKRVSDPTTGELSHTITLSNDSAQETNLIVKKHTKDGTRYSKRIFRENAEKLVNSLIEDLEKEKGEEAAKPTVELLRDHLYHFIDTLEGEPEFTDDAFEAQIRPLIKERDNFIALIARTWQEAKNLSHLPYKKLLKKMRTVEQDYVVRHDSNTHIVCELDFEKSSGTSFTMFSTQQVFARLTSAQKEAVQRKAKIPSLREQVRYHTDPHGNSVNHQAHPSHARNVEGLSNAYHSHIFIREGNELSLKFDAYRHSVYPPIEVKDKILRQAMAMRNAEQLLHQIIIDKLQHDPEFQAKVDQGSPIELTLATQNILTSSLWQPLRPRGENENRQLAEINLALKSISGTHTFTYSSTFSKQFVVNIKTLHVNNEVNMSGRGLRKLTRSRNLLAGESAYLINRPGIVQLYGDGISKILSLLALNQPNNEFEPSMRLIEKDRQIIAENLNKSRDKTNQAIEAILREAGFITKAPFVNPLNPFEVNYEVVQPLYQRLIDLSQKYEEAMVSDLTTRASIRRDYDKIESLIKTLRIAVANHYESAYEAVKEHHNRLIENLEELLKHHETAIKQIPVYNGYNLKDFIRVFSDYQRCYFDLRASEAHKYEGPARFLLAQKMLGYEVELGCKSSEDRTSRAFNKVEELIVLREKTGEFPHVNQHPYQEPEAIDVSKKIHRESSGNVITGLNDAPGLQVEQELAGKHLGFNRFDKWVAGHFPKYAAKLPKAAYLLKKRYKHQLALMQGELIDIIKHSKTVAPPFEKSLIESQISVLLENERIPASALYQALQKVAPLISDRKLKARIERTLAISTRKNPNSLIWETSSSLETEQKASESLVALRQDQKIHQQKIQDLKTLASIFNKIVDTIKLSSASFIFTHLADLKTVFDRIHDELETIKKSLSKEGILSYEAITIYDTIESETEKTNAWMDTIAHYFNAPSERLRGLQIRNIAPSSTNSSHPSIPRSSSIASDKILSEKTLYYVDPKAGEVYTNPNKAQQKLHYAYREKNNDELLEYTPARQKIVKAPRQIVGFTDEEKSLIKAMVEHTHALGWTDISLGGEKRLLILAYIYFTAYDEAKIQLGLANAGVEMQFSFENAYTEVSSLQKDAASYITLKEELKKHYLDRLSIVNGVSTQLTQKSLFNEFQEASEKIKQDSSRSPSVGA